jgi:hypothetical protein
MAAMSENADKPISITAIQRQCRPTARANDPV